MGVRQVLRHSTEHGSLVLYPHTSSSPTETTDIKQIIKGCTDYAREVTGAVATVFISPLEVYSRLHFKGKFLFPVSAVL